MVSASAETAKESMIVGLSVSVGVVGGCRGSSNTLCDPGGPPLAQRAAEAGAQVEWRAQDREWEDFKAEAMAGGAS